MTDDAVLMLIWKCDGETLIIPAIDHDGRDGVLMRELIDKLPDHVKNKAEHAVLRGVIADQKGMIAELRDKNQQQAAAVIHLKMENARLNNLFTTMLTAGTK